MRAYQIGDQTGLDGLNLAERPIPTPGPGQALVKVRSAGLNHRDMGLLKGTYRRASSAIQIPLSDGVGDIVSFGEGPDRGLAIGDRVTAVHFSKWVNDTFEAPFFGADIGITMDGWLAEYVLLPVQALVRVPDDMADDHAAAMSASGGTVWNILHHFANLKPGDTVLTLGTGGVSIVAVQLARLAGARVVITSSSDEKLARAKAYGADICINYTERPDWDAAVREATGGRGVDVVIETVGLATLEKSLAACAMGGRIGLIGSMGDPDQRTTTLMGLVGKNAVIKGITSASRQMLEEMYRAIAGRGLQSPVDRTFAFSDARAAYDLLAQGGQVGKIVINRFDA